jgi:hypothetical protein
MREGVEHYGIGAVLITVVLFTFFDLDASLPAKASGASSESVGTPDPPPADFLRAAEQRQAESEQAEQAEAERAAAEQAAAEQQAAQQAVVPPPPPEPQVQQPVVAAAAAPAPPPAPTYSYTASGGVRQWEGLTRQVMAELGIPDYYLEGILGQMNSESGGDPDAINLWDSNAAAGIPSQGLMQTIPGTFAAYTAPGCTNIVDPYCNIFAGLNYAMNRYGNSRFDLWSQGIHYGY